MTIPTILNLKTPNHPLHAPNLVSTGSRVLFPCGLCQQPQWPNVQLSCVDNLLYETQWLRIAYHDMATHNIDNGTGRLDASIQFELDRTQNIGIGKLNCSDFD
ncbi:hypothetical protein BT96DRAFT_1020251 [Gymnopus androsaceus JB14]|uniref:Uncharacterized protein n=1 Tax=Gymnopus androsaceus JB14 TaxID=1447944 RepID=A0A6A4HI90_9AGAR|nr:hypothetical protein BT96DRAFT_1020251 [Gymnopus androsaceus JB14]